MAWATKITSSEQVEYRLAGACGCDAEHQVDVDAQVEYRLKDDLRWIGSGLGDVGLVAGEAVDKAAARALMDGRHPSLLDAKGKNKKLIEPKKVVSPAARVAAAPFVAAIRAVAEAAAVEPGEVFRHATAAARFARLERGLLRDGDRHTVPIGDLEQLAAATRETVAGVVVPGLAAIYSPALLAEAAAHRDERVRVDARGHDVVLNLPKSVSALYAVVDPVTAVAIEAEYMAAVGETITALEGWASYGVTGHHGDGQVAARVESSGFIGWSMLHRSARPVDGRVGDPHLHAHAVIAHMVKCEDGTWRVPGSGGRDIYRHVAASGELVKARVRARLSARFGVAWELDPHNGEWEIVGIPAALREEFSSRAAQIVGAAGGASAAEQRVAAAKLAESRPEVEPADVRTQWRVAAENVVGDVEAMVATAMPGPGPGGPVAGAGPDGPSRGPAPGYGPDSPAPVGPGPGEAIAAGPVAEPDIDELVAAVWTGKHALTAHSKKVARVQILTAVAAACPGGVADVAQLEALTDKVIEFGPAIPVDQLHASHHSNTDRWTTRDIVDAEDTIATGAHLRMNTAAAAVDPIVAVATVTTWSAQRGLQLSVEQLGAVERLTTGGHGIDAVIGVAGAGKTTLMAAARTVWEHGGYTVKGASTAAVASAGLAAEAGITSRTIASWLKELDQPARPGLADVDVLVVDEGAMVDDRALARLITAAQPSPANPTGTKIVLIGDPLQLRAIGVGGGFKAVHDIVGGATLSENWRQRDPIERDALQVWREGARRTALDQLAGAGRIHAVELPEQVHTEMLTAWAQARTRWAGDLHGELAGLVVLAARNTDVEQLNAGARALRTVAGELGADTVFRRTAAAGGGTIALAPGDLVRVRQNDYRSRTSNQPDVLNGYRAVVLAIDKDRQVQIQWRLPGSTQLSKPVWIRPEQISAGHLSHGYAMTIASSQGLTCDLALASGVGADAHSLYPAITRARDTTHLWLARTAVEDPATEAAHGPATNDDRLARTISAYADVIEHDGPDTLISDLLSHDQTAAHVRDILAQARQRAADRNREPEVPHRNESDGPDEGWDAELAQVAELLRASRPDPQPVPDRVPDAQPGRQAVAHARQPAGEQPDLVDQGARDSAGRSLADIVASLTDEQRQEAQRRWETRDPDRAQQRQAAPELAQLTPWQERLHGHIRTKQLPALADQARAQARHFDDAADRLETGLQTAPAPARLGVAGALLQHADASQAAADSAHAHVVQLAEQIRAAYEANRRDDLARQIAQAKADRLLGDVTGRHARTAADLTTQISTRMEEIHQLTASQHHLREIETTRAEQARALRQQAGAHPHEPTEDTLTRLNRQYTAEDANNRASAISYRQAAQQQNATVTALDEEAALRRQLSPAATGVEDKARKAAGIAAAQAAKQAAETAARIRAAQDRHYRPPTPGPSRGPSLGR